MLVASAPRNPAVLSYLALRKAVGIVALALPLTLWLSTLLDESSVVPASISGYYYGEMRDFFVGSLCAIAMFMLCCRGYDRKDEIAGVFSAVCTLAVAFFPTAPEHGATPQQYRIGELHYTFAALLFATLAYFCLVLFKMTARGHRLTPKKRQRNGIYTICGIAILTSMLLVYVFHRLHVEHLIGKLAPTFCFESTSLIAFGIAWLVKGETFLKDVQSEHIDKKESELPGQSNHKRLADPFPI